MQLFVQLCALNEREHIGAVIGEIPRVIPGFPEIDRVVVVVVDDGSTDDTGAVARAAGADVIVRHHTRKGLARAFQFGVDTCLAHGADIIVNLDADGQYPGGDIPALIAPILKGNADVVIGDRQTQTLGHFSPIKRLLQKAGSNVVQRAAGVQIPDAVSGFRAYERDAALRLFVSTRFSYTVQSIIQAAKLGLRIESVPITARPTTRPSRLHKGIVHFVSNQALILLRTYASYEPMRFFGGLALPFLLLGVGLLVRATIIASQRGGQFGNVPSLLIGVVSLLIGLLSLATGLIADRVYENRRLIEEMLYRLRKQQAADAVQKPAPGSGQR
jgi:glycosyltransferase involved in cell wall biosynthesis